MKNSIEDLVGDKLLNASLDNITAIIQNFPGMVLEASVTEEDILDVSGGIFSTFYNTASYYVDYALEYMTPVLGCVCSYFRGSKQSPQCHSREGGNPEKINLILAQKNIYLVK